MKICKLCQLQKSVDAFHIHTGNRRRPVCAECMTRIRDERGTDRAYKIKRLYSLSVSDMESMFRKQNGLCAVCETTMMMTEKKTKRPYVDHDHKTGQVRGLLCHKCNTGLGYFDDSSELLSKAHAYLLKSVKSGV